jgi:hypothetical protein
MYDWDLPPVVAADPLPTQCAPLPKGRRIKPPDRGTLATLECVDRYAPIASEVLRQYERSLEPAVRAACEDILNRLWAHRRLSNAMKDRLVNQYLRVTLAQLPLPRPGLELQVRTEMSFHFPAVTFTVRALHYRNGRPERGLYPSSKTAALERPGQLTSLGTVLYTRGDTYAFDIVFDEMAGNAVVWRKVVRTNWIRVT